MGMTGAAAAALQERLEEAYPDVQIYLHIDTVGDLVLDKIVVPPAVREKGVGTQIMELIIAAADDAGCRTTTTPSADFGGTLKRLTSFYRRFGFVPNSGRNKDFTTRQSMLRNPE